MVSIILVSHGQIASSIYDVAKIIMPDFIGNVFIIDGNEGTDQLEAQLSDALKKVTNSEVLILTDVCGATPDNIVKRTLNDKNIAIISGLSLPMLLKVFNYSTHPLAELVKIVTEGAKRSITTHQDRCHD